MERNGTWAVHTPEWNKTSEYHVMHADETVVEVRKDGRPAGRWEPDVGVPFRWTESKPVILYLISEDPEKEHAREFWRLSGICVTDGYQLYHSIADEREDLTISGCCRTRAVGLPM